jgi:endogenous inhibitor of DNA gyrase (YacG/DUF329 family)
MKLAMYKGPAKTVLHRLLHWVICVFTASRYSHCELVIDGWCWTSSNRDGGVRCKAIDLTSSAWDVFEISGDALAARDWFVAHRGEGYDWLGVLRFLLPFLPNSRTRWFCSESCAAALGLPNPQSITPQRLLELLTPRRPVQRAVSTSNSN